MSIIMNVLNSCNNYFIHSECVCVRERERCSNKNFAVCKLINQHILQYFEST